jgi:hypothetical protein
VGGSNAVPLVHFRPNTTTMVAAPHIMSSTTATTTATTTSKKYNHWDGGDDRKKDDSIVSFQVSCCAVPPTPPPFFHSATGGGGISARSVNRRRRTTGGIYMFLTYPSRMTCMVHHMVQYVPRFPHSARTKPSHVWLPSRIWPCGCLDMCVDRHEFTHMTKNQSSYSSPMVSSL